MRIYRSDRLTTDDVGDMLGIPPMEVGRDAAIARRIGVTRQAVCAWRGKVPLSAIARIVVATYGRYELHAPGSYFEEVLK